MLQGIIICSALLAVGVLALRLALQMSEYLTKRPFSVNRLFQGLRPKLWMTVGLGIFFALLYFVTVMFLSQMLDAAEMRYYLFQMALKDPVLFAYCGLTLFVSISLGILIVRSIIKRVYNCRR